MPTQLSTIHEEAVSATSSKIETTSKEVVIAIGESIAELKNGRIPSAGKAYEDHVRGLRRTALVRFSSIKSWLGPYISSNIIQQIRTSGLYKLHEIIEAVNATEAKRTKVVEERARIFNDDVPLADYEKFVLYGEPEFVKEEKNILARIFKRKSKVNNTDNVSPAPTQNTSAIVQTYEKHKRKKTMSSLAGIIVTALCAAADFSIIFAVFQSANLGVALSIATAIISAAVLDAPPYVLGYLWTQRDDSKRFWELRNEPNDPGATNEMKRYNITITVLLIVILLIFISYLMLRIILFFGGGNFDLAFHSILDGNFRFEGTTFNGADLLSTFVPIGTSVVAFAIGMLLFSSHTDYVKNAITIIKKELNDRIKRCEETIVDCDEKHKNLNAEIPALKREIWTFYMGPTKAFPPDDVTFREQVSVSFQKLNLALYKQTYTACSLLLRDHAVAMLQNINYKLTPYAADQATVVSMLISTEENTFLDDFWVKSSGGATSLQHEITANDLQAIEKHVKQLLLILT